jgi:acetyl esterase/lipase
MFKLNLFLFLLLGTLAMACWHPATPQDAPSPRTDAPAANVSRPADPPGSVQETLPRRIETTARYLFYLHGAILEGTSGRAVSQKFGAYEYEQILGAFARRGFTVISEVRSRGMAPEKYAAKVAQQVDALLKAGVAPQRITVVGASRGGGIALLISTLLRNREVNFVILASCADSSFFKKLHPSLYGNILSIYDRDDDTGAGTCQRFIAQSPGVGRYQEIVLQTGLGHGIVYHPLKDWLDPLFNWADQP